MPLIDPSGLLQRMPELEAVAMSDGPVRAALESGDAFKVYRTLRWRSWTGKLSAHRELVRELLNNRRLFARPLTSNPSLHTVNSFGTNFVGESETGEDGTYITNHCLVIFFKIPLLPLGSYLVGPGDTTNSYRIFARVPQGGVTWAWSRATALAAALLVASAAWGAFQDSRYATVHVANGFTRPLDATVGDQHVSVAPHTTSTVRVRVGTQPARATVEGKVVDEGPMEVVSGNDAFVWNVGGVAPLLRAQINYYRVQPANPQEPQPEWYCGQRLVVQRDVDFVFREPDKTVSMGKGQQMATRSLLTADWPEKQKSPSPCFALSIALENEQGLRTVAEAMFAAGELPSQAVLMPVTMALFNGHDADAWAMVRELHARGFDPDVERTMLWVAEETGHLEEAVKELEAGVAEHPNDGDRAALALFSRTPPPTLAQIESLLAKFPDTLRLVEGAQLAAEREGANDRAVDLFLKRLELGGDEVCREALEPVHPALLANRAKDLHDALGACFEGGDEPTFSAVLASMVLSRALKLDPNGKLEALDAEPKRKRALLLVGDSVEGVSEGLAPVARLAASAKQSGSLLLKEVATLPKFERAAIDEELGLLAWAEAVARHDDAAKWLARRVRLRVVNRAAIEAFISGSSPELPVAQLTPEARAVAYLARSGADGVPVAEKRRLRELGKKDAVGSRFLLAALETWP